MDLQLEPLQKKKLKHHNYLKFITILIPPLDV